MGEGGIDTGYDHTVPHVAVAMRKEDPEAYPRCPLPEGYSFAFYREGLEAGWARLQREAGGIGGAGVAEAIFRKEFLRGERIDWANLRAEPEGGAPARSLPRYADAAARVLFALDSAGEAAGTASLWDGTLFGPREARLHWVAVAPAHQGRGIAKALLTRLFDRYRELGLSGAVYLTTQTGSHRAIRIYRQFGFAPHMGDRPANWASEGGEAGYRAENERGWAIIREATARADRDRIGRA